jgi:hypothetical protein
VAMALALRTKLSPLSDNASNQPVIQMRPSQLPELIAELPPQTTTTSTDYRLPNELMLRILDCFIPRSGRYISSDTDFDQHNLPTISALLRNSHMLKRETMNRAFNTPLRIRYHQRQAMSLYANGKDQRHLQNDVGQGPSTPACTMEFSDRFLCARCRTTPSSTLF